MLELAFWGEMRHFNHLFMTAVLVFPGSAISVVGVLFFLA